MGSPRPGDMQGTPACRRSSLGVGTCETWAETHQLISCHTGRWGEKEMRPAGPVMPSTRSPLEVLGEDGVALPLREAEGWLGQGGVRPTFFLPSGSRVAMPVAPLPCRYSRCHAGTAVSMPVLLLPGYAESVGRGCRVALRMREMGDEAGMMPCPLNPTSLPAQGPAGYGPAWGGPGGDRGVIAHGSWCDGRQPPGLGPVGSLALRLSSGMAQCSGRWRDDLTAAWYAHGGVLATGFIKSSNKEARII